MPSPNDWNVIRIPPTDPTEGREPLCPFGLVPVANEARSTVGLPPISLSGRFTPLNESTTTEGNSLLERIRLGPPTLVRHEAGQDLLPFVALIAKAFPKTRLTVLLSSSQAKSQGQAMADDLISQGINAYYRGPNIEISPQVLITAKKYFGEGLVFHHCNGILVAPNVENLLRPPSKEETFDLPQLFNTGKPTYIQEGVRLVGFLPKDSPKAIELKAWAYFGINELLLTAGAEVRAPGRIWWLGRKKGDKSDYHVNLPLNGPIHTAKSRAMVWRNHERNAFIAKQINRIRGAAGRSQKDSGLPDLAGYGKTLALVVLNNEHKQEMLSCMAGHKVKAQVYTFDEAERCKHDLPQMLLRCDGGVGALPFIAPEDGTLTFDLMDRSPAYLVANYKKRHAHYLKEGYLVGVNPYLDRWHRVSKQKNKHGQSAKSAITMQRNA